MKLLRAWERRTLLIFSKRRERISRNRVEEIMVRKKDADIRQMKRG